MIGETQMKDLVFQFRKKIRDTINKHRREHAVIPDPEDYIKAWAQAITEEAPMIREVRRPGRPPKGEPKGEPKGGRKGGVKVITPQQLK
jgi:hypothetical protein